MFGDEAEEVCGGWITEGFTHCNTEAWGFPGGAVVKNLPANAGDTGLSPGPGRSHMPRSN